MLRTYVSLAACLLLVYSGAAQNWSDLSGPSTDPASISAIPVHDLGPLDNASLYGQELTRRGPGVAPKFAEARRVQLDPHNSGQWETPVQSVVNVWRLRVKSGNALSLNLGFQFYELPEGAKLYLFTPDMREVVGPFTQGDNEAHKQLWSPILKGEEIVIELQVPKRAMADFDLLLTHVNHGFTGFHELLSLRSGSCNVDVICPQGAPYGDIIRSVAVISLGGTTFCSGFLVNNTSGDRKPYFMTADHCGIGSTNASSLVVFWNYENSTCRAPGSGASGSAGDGTLTQFNTGSFFRADYGPSDFTLVELDDTIPCAFNVFYAGWDRRDQATTSAIGIHHPSTDEKRISFEDDPTTITAYLSATVNTASNHIRVADWDLGTTEGGSSGSPLFSPEKRVIGQLHGGFAACGNNDDDWYGRVFTSWTGGGTNATRLSNWLDPIGTGALTLDGLEGCGAVDSCTISASIGTTGPCIVGSNTFTQDVVVTYMDPPVDGDLLVNGQTFPITGSPQTVPLTLQADGNNQDLTAWFSNKPFCSVLLSGAITAPSPCTPISCQSYASANVPVFIDSAGTPSVTSTLTIPDNVVILDINVDNLHGTHTYISDLTFTLTSPTGTSVILMNQVCGSEDNFNLGFDDDAASALVPCPPIGGGSYIPAASLAAFHGEQANGNWTLTIDDNFNLDGGSLNGWTLEICFFDTVTCEDATELSASNVQATSATLNWNAPVNADHYALRGGLAGSNPANYVVIAIPSPATTALSVSGLTPLTSFEWQVQVHCSADETVSSAWSPLNIFTTLGCLAPTGAFVDNISPATARLNWTPYSGATHNQLRGRLLGSTSWVTVNLGGGASQLNATGLAPGTSYEWYVRSYCNGTFSPFTPLDTFSTTPPPPGGAFKTEPEFSFGIYPNPSGGEVVLTLGLGGNTDINSSLHVYNALGQSVHEQLVQTRGGQWQTTLSFPSAGVYIAELLLPSGTRKSLKFIIQ